MKKPSPKTRQTLTESDVLAVEARLRKAAWFTPESGFAERWQTHWQHEQARLQRLADGKLLVASGVTLAGLLGWVGWWVWQLVIEQPALLSGTIAFFVQGSARLWTLLRVLVTMLSLVPLPIWFASSAAALGLLVVWLLLYQQTPQKKEIR